jgi:hypothetical protein
MNQMTLQAFTDELEKISARLNKAEERERAVKFAIIGTALGPVIAGTGGAIKGGKGSFLKNVTQDAASLPRWIGSTATTSGMISGGIPLIQRRVLENLSDKAERRIEKARSLAERRNARGH